MLPWRDAQRDWTAALLDPDQPPPAGLVGPEGEPSPRRFAVYRNNVVAGLTATLTDAFPAVCRIVGAPFFRAMARAYLSAEPPASPILLDYGAGFPAFVARFSPAASLPYLPDVARIERAWTEAYHAAEAEPLDPAALASLDPDRLPRLRLHLHPSLRVVRSALPALTIWRMNVADGVPAPVDLASGGEDTLVLRAAAEVEVRSLPGGGAGFLAALGAGGTVTESVRAGLAADDGFDLAANLAGLIGAGGVIGYGFGG